MTSDEDFSFILIGRSKEDLEVNVQQIAKKFKNVEILIALGNNPSAQRNIASKFATRKYLVFLDNDSYPDSNLLNYFIDAFENYDNPDVVGGPSVFEDSSDKFKLALQLVMSSVLALGPSKARYHSLGRVRISSEKELILCNLCIKKDVFDRTNGFNVDLYPNEENEFLNRLSHSAKIYYHPLAIVYRPPRGSFKEFFIQMFRYGRGRAKHLDINPSFFQAIYLLPTFFVFYVIFSVGSFFILGETWQNIIFLIPLIIYFCLLIFGSAISCLFFNFSLMLYMIPLFITCHIAYGVGYLSWFFYRKSHNKSTICLTSKVSLDENGGLIWQKL